MKSRDQPAKSESVPYTSDPTIASGFLFKTGKRWYIDSLNSFGEQIRVTKRNDLVVGALAEVKLGSGEDGSLATVRRMIPCDREDERAIQGILSLYQVPTTWNSKNDSFDVPNAVDEDEIAGRVDLRHLPFVTIDGDSALDFDDAVFAEAAADGGCFLSVAIADVAHYVVEDSVFDVEARERGNSIYLPDFVVPMLPPQLSNGICSLRPNVDRLAVVCKLRVTAQGKVVQHEFHEAVIRSRARLTYSEVSVHGREGVPGCSKAVCRSLRYLFEVRDLLRKQREARGALDFLLIESSVRLDDEGNPIGVAMEERNEAHELVEEAMIAANVAAAEFLMRHNQKPIFRVHEQPDKDALRDLAADLRHLQIPDVDALDDPSAIKQLLHKLRNARLYSRVWEMRVLRAMTQACYSLANHGHFGLGLPNYLHFTSPIRRYADLQVHRLVKGCIRGLPHRPELVSEAANIASHVTMTERRAAEIERRVSMWLKCVLLKQKENQVFDGTVVGIADFGVFVELDEYLVSGLIHVKSLPNDYYLNRGTSYEGQSTGVTYRLGDRLNVRLVQAIGEAGRIDLVDTASRRGITRKSKRRRGNR